LARPTGGLVEKTLLVSALGCGVTGVLFLSEHTAVGLALCAVASADLVLLWLLRCRAPGYRAEAGASPR
jgi:hypothetical protein